MNEQMNTDYESSKPSKTQVREIQVPNELDLGKKSKYQSNSWFFLEQGRAKTELMI